MNTTAQAYAGWLAPQLAALPRRLRVEWPGGGLGSPRWDVRLRVQGTRALSWLTRGDAGRLADAYVRGDLEIDGAMPDVMAIVAELVGDPRRTTAPHAFARMWQALRSRLAHTLARDARQVRSHYDTGDAFFALWLDPLRVYSCAYYKDDGIGDARSLEEAQQAKLDLVCRKLQLAPGQRLLDVGAGWGALVLWAAKHYRVRAVGITLSHRQHAYMVDRIEDAALAGSIDVRLLDYRALPRDALAFGGFDRIASVGMFEHVGLAQLDGYFGTLAGLLRPGGLLLNHGIASASVDHAELGRGIGDFIERYIFPGGELVHVSDAVRSLAHGGFELVDAENLRPHYARTLWAWSAALERQLDAARALVPEATLRAYRLYLAGCAMSFERGWLALYQLLAAKPDGDIAGHAMRGAQSAYLFRRGHMPG